MKCGGSQGVWVDICVSWGRSKSKIVEVRMFRGINKNKNENVGVSVTLRGYFQR